MWATFDFFVILLICHFSNKTTHCPRTENGKEILHTASNHLTKSLCVNIYRIPITISVYVISYPITMIYA